MRRGMIADNLSTSQKAKTGRDVESLLFSSGYESIM
jgi:hypothetical protein